MSDLIAAPRGTGHALEITWHGCGHVMLVRIPAPGMLVYQPWCPRCGERWQQSSRLVYLDG